MQKSVFFALLGLLPCLPSCKRNPFTQSEQKSTTPARNQEFRATIDDDTVLQVVLDRFRDGNPTNNVPTTLQFRGTPAKSDAVAKLYDATKKKNDLYWGGDIEGLMQRADEISQAGFSAVWISPHVLQATTYDDEVSAYHGYWAKDWFRLDPHLTRTGGDLTRTGANDFELFQSFVDLFHSKGIKVIIDIVYNHTSPADFTPYLPKSRIPTFHENGRLEKKGAFVADFSPPFITQFPLPESKRTNWFNPVLPEGRLGEYCKSMGIDSDFTCYHTMGDLYTLTGFNPFNEQFQAYMREATQFWIKFGIDGLRLDTYKNLPRQTWLSLLGTADADFEANKTSGKNKPLAEKLILIGEWFDGGPWDETNWKDGKVMPGGGLDYARTVKAGERPVSMMDFSMATQIKRIIGGRGGQGFSVRALNDVAIGAGMRDPDSGRELAMGLATFFDNHDKELFLHHTWNEDTKYQGCTQSDGRAIQGDKDAGGFLIDYKAAMNQAITYLLMQRGMPMVFYADLQHIQPTCFPTEGEGRCSRPMLNTDTSALIPDPKLKSIIATLSRARNGLHQGKPNPHLQPVLRTGDHKVLPLPQKNFWTGHANCQAESPSSPGNYDRNDLTVAMERCTPSEDSCMLFFSSMNFGLNGSKDTFAVSGLRFPTGEYTDPLTGMTHKVEKGEKGEKAGNSESGTRLQVSLGNYESIVLFSKRTPK